VDGADDEVVPRGAIQVEGDTLEPQRLGDRARDLRQHGIEAAVGPHEARDVQQALDALEGDELIGLRSVVAHLP
jgi:hypothetical protein